MRRFPNFAIVLAALLSGAAPVPKPVDVTRAGFPFRIGNWSESGRCDPNRDGFIEYNRASAHPYGGDQAIEFTRILRIDATQYKFTETIEYDESDKSVDTVDYEKLSDTMMKVTSHHDYDQSGKRIAKVQSTIYRLCRAR